MDSKLDNIRAIVDAYVQESAGHMIEARRSLKGESEFLLALYGKRAEAEINLQARLTIGRILEVLKQ